MIEPVQSGTALLNDITTMQVASGAVAIWWLGQSGYAIKTASALFTIDLYLSEHLTTKYANTDKPHVRMTAAPLRGNDLTGVEWVFASHRHSDHLDPATIPLLFVASPQAKLILPAAAVDHAVALGLNRDRLISTRGDETLQAGPITVHSIPSAHETLDYTAEQGYPFLGYVFQSDGVTLYHSGDTLIYDGLAERLSRFDIDIAFLPINGHGLPGTPGNMDAQEAVSLAKQIGVKLLIPCHYDMFTFNTGDVNEFKRLADAAGQPTAILRCGEKFYWQR